MTTYDDDVRRALKAAFDAGDLQEIGESTSVFLELGKIYPARGSKIDWNRVSGTVGRTEKDHFLQQMRFLEFFDEVRSRFRLTGLVVYVGDSATNFALKGSIDSIRLALPELLEVPQHHYLVGPDYGWCMCMTMEGDMDFGYAASLSQR